MTITLEDAGGFGAHTYLLTDRTNSGCVATPASWHSSELAVGMVPNAGVSWPQTADVETGSDWITQSINVRFYDITTDTVYQFLRAMDDGTPSVVWRMEMDNGDIKLYDSTSTLIGTVTTGISIDTWYRVTIKYKMANSSDVNVWWSASGSYHSTTPQLSSTGDFLPGASTESAFSLIAGGSQGSSIPMYYGAWVVRVDDGASIGTNDTRQTPCFCATYTSGITTAAPDSGDNLTSGNWDDAEELPEGTSPVYYTVVEEGDPPAPTMKEGLVYCDPNGAAIPGPADDENMDDATWLRAFWVWRWKARQDTGFNKYPDFQGWYGCDSSTTYGSVLTGNDAYQSEVVTQDSGGSQFPGSSDNMRIGFQADMSVANRCDSVYVEDQWAGLVAEYPEAPAGRRVCIEGVVVQV